MSFSSGTSRVGTSASDIELTRLIDSLGAELVGSGRGRAAFRPPADSRDVEAWELRIGQPLSLSYRLFLSVRDGWEGYKDGLTLIGAAEEAFVEARADVDLTMREYVDAWMLTYGEPTEEAIANYESKGSLANPVEANGLVYAANKIPVGTDFNGGLILLNPRVRDGDGDYEAIRFDSRYGASGRYANFRVLLQADLDALLAAVETR